jgi:hypothetical protein
LRKRADIEYDFDESDLFVLYVPGPGVADGDLFILSAWLKLKL